MSDSFYWLLEPSFSYWATLPSLSTCICLVLLKLDMPRFIDTHRRPTLTCTKTEEEEISGVGGEGLGRKDVGRAAAGM